MALKKEGKGLARVSESKLRLLCLMKFFEEKTDIAHTVTLPQLIGELKCQGFSAERKSIYDDIETLRKFGLDIKKTKTKTFNYYLDSTSQKREGAEAAFKETRRAAALCRAAIKGKQKIRFKASRWEVEMSKKTGSLTPVKKPMLLEAYPLRIWGDSGSEKLACFLPDFEQEQEFLVSELGELSVLKVPGLPRQREEHVVVEAEAGRIHDLLCRFGTNVTVEQGKKGKLQVGFNTGINEGFYAALFSLGTAVGVTSPKKVREELRERGKAIGKLYK